MLSKDQISQFFSKKASWILMCLMLYIASLAWSKFLLSISMWGLSALGVFEYVKGAKIAIRPRKDFFKQFIAFFKTPSYALFVLVLAVIMLNYFGSSNEGDWLSRLRVKAPFIVMPLSFFLLPKLNKKQFYFLLLWTVGIGTWSALQILFRFALNYEAYLLMIEQGQHIPTPLNPLRYSILIAIAIFSGIYLHINRKDSSLPSSLLKLNVVLCTFLFIFLHILSVRSGLVIFYGSAFCLVTWASIKFKKYLWILVFALFSVSAVFTAYHLVPSLKKKIGYVIWDLTKFQDKSTEGYSDSERILSWQAGWILFTENPILGTGIGDLRDEMTKTYKDRFDLELRKRPHNQYLTFLAGTGLVGFLFFIIGFYGPLYYTSEPNWLLGTVFLVASISFLVENTIDDSIGTGIVLGFILIYMHRKKE